MSEYIFLFDLDSTITCKEILPTIAEKVNRQKEMRELTETTLKWNLSIQEQFPEKGGNIKRYECIRNASDGS